MEAHGPGFRQLCLGVSERLWAISLSNLSCRVLVCDVGMITAALQDTLEDYMRQCMQISDIPHLDHESNDATSLPHPPQSCDFSTQEVKIGLLIGLGEGKRGG